MMVRRFIPFVQPDIEDIATAGDVATLVRARTGMQCDGALVIALQDPYQDQIDGIRTVMHKLGGREFSVEDPKSYQFGTATATDVSKLILSHSHVLAYTFNDLSELARVRLFPATDFSGTEAVTDFSNSKPVADAVAATIATDISQYKNMKRNNVLLQ